MPQGDAREGARAAVHARLRASARRDPVAALAWIDTLDLATSRDAERAAGVVEALSPDADSHVAVFIGLFERGVEATRRSGCRRIPTPVFTSLAFLEASRSARALDALKPRYLAIAQAPEPCLRLVAVDLLGHFAGSADARTAMESLLKDTDWRVRQEAETVLDHEGVLPGGYSVPLTDLLVRWLRRFF